MKKSLLLPIILILFVLVGCSKEYNKLILGKWIEINYGDTYTFFPDNKGVKYNTGLGALGMKYLSDWPFEFSWNINGDILVINFTDITDINSKTKKYKIVEINQNDMKFLEDSNGKELTIYFVRPDKY